MGGILMGLWMFVGFPAVFIAAECLSNRSDGPRGRTADAVILRGIGIALLVGVGFAVTVATNAASIYVALKVLQ